MKSKKLPKQQSSIVRRIELATCDFYHGRGTLRVRPISSKSPMESALIDAFQRATVLTDLGSGEEHVSPVSWNTN